MTTHDQIDRADEPHTGSGENRAGQLGYMQECPVTGSELAPIATPLPSEDFEPEIPRASGLLDDVIVAHVPHLAIVSLSDFRKVLAMRDPPGRYAGRPYVHHPLSKRWQCPRCGSTLHHNVSQQWLRCPNTTARWLPGQERSCDAPPIDLAAAEQLMFRALETFSPGREGRFAEKALRRYREILEAASGERDDLLKERARHEAAMDALAEELVQQKDRPLLRASIERRSDAHAAELERIIAKLQDMPAIPQEPDPEPSLLQLENMIEALKMRTPFGFGANRDALHFRNRLHDAIIRVTMVEKGEDIYDVEFEFNASAAVGMPGQTVELVRFHDENLRAGRFKRRRKEAMFKADWEAGKFAISDRAWKKLPGLPLARKMFGSDLRWLIDTMILTAESGMGTRAVVHVAGRRVAGHRVQLYRGSKECEALRQWLQEVRPRKHEYRNMIPTRTGSTTLRERMVAVGHPLVSLRRFERSEVPAPLTDAEFEELVTRLPTVEAHWRDNMRYRVNQTIEMLRVNGTFCDDGRQCYRGWLTHQLKRGTFLIFVNFFRELEGLPALQSLPELPNSRHMVRPRDANGKVCD